jgi:hypothetical protein
VAKSARRSFFELEMPARHLSTNSRLAGVAESAEEVDADRKITRKFSPGVGDVIHSLVFGEVDAIATFRNRDMRRQREVVGPLRSGWNE